tara:strand:- start:12320 stop:13057 length:738 start_codon:yes stop_codon:yes gene_type:complete
MKIAKYQGCGNDFIISEDADFNKLKSNTDIIKKLCQRKYSVGADGFVYLEKNDKGFRWDFWNADASEAEMCGNAARCVAAYAYDRYQLSQFVLDTKCGKLCLAKAGEGYSVEMPKISELKIIQEDVCFINTGVPHVLLIKPKNEKALIKEYRYYDNGIDASGCNVSVVEKDSKGIKVKTFERGVEGFTLACGTGAVAAAAYFHQQQGMNDVALSMPGGDLRIRFQSNKVFLEGPALKVFEGEANV